MKDEKRKLAKDFPILEFDNQKIAVIEPTKVIKPINIADTALIIFFHEILKKQRINGNLKIIHTMKSEMGDIPVYETDYQGKRIAVVHPCVGAPLAAGILEELIALGVKKALVIGACGVLKKEITKGQLVIPTSAIRDEGTSYHYLSPSREVEPSKIVVELLEDLLNQHKISYIKGKTWTTDAFYRETPEKVALRVSEGCITVEMEASAFFAVSKFRNIHLAQLLYGGDDVSGIEWDSRNFTDATSIREKLFWFGLEVCTKLSELE
jgi:uridine phosphorylase